MYVYGIALLSNALLILSLSSCNFLSKEHKTNKQRLDNATIQDPVSCSEAPITDPKKVYLRSDGNDETAVLGKKSCAYASAQAAVNAAINANPSASNIITIDVGTGSFGNILIVDDFGEHIHWNGMGYESSFIGDVAVQISHGVQGADYIEDQREDENNENSLCTGGQDGQAGTSGSSGFKITIYGNENVSFGNIISSGGNGGGGGSGSYYSSDCNGDMRDYAAGDGGSGGSAGAIFLTGAKVLNIKAMGGAAGSSGDYMHASDGSPGNAGSVTLVSTQALSIESMGGDGTEGDGTGSYGGTDPTQGGNISLSNNSSADSCNASSGQNGSPYGSAQYGGDITVSANSNCSNKSSEPFVASYNTGMVDEDYREYHGRICDLSSSPASISTDSEISTSSPVSISFTGGSSGFYNIEVNEGDLYYSDSVNYNDLEWQAPQGNGDGTAVFTVSDYKCDHLIPASSVQVNYTDDSYYGP